MKKLWLLMAVLAVLTLPAVVLAQGPANQARTALEQDNFVVLDAGVYTPPGGAPDPNHVFAVMSFSLDNSEVKSALARSGTAVERTDNALWAHAIAGYYALREAYPRATTMTVIVVLGYFSNTFSTDTATFDRSQLSGASQAAYKVNQIGNVHRLDLVAARSGSTSSTFSSTSPAAVGTPSRTPTRRPLPTATPVLFSENPCRDFTPKPSPDKALIWIRNQYGALMRFTFGGGDWGTHDYDIPGDGNWRYFEAPPGTYTWTASIPGVGKANGERQGYAAGQCYSIDLRG